MRTLLLLLMLQLAEPKAPTWKPPDLPTKPPAIPAGPLVPAKLPPVEIIPPTGPFIVTVNPQRAYAARTTYGIHDMVTHKGDSYVALTSNLTGVEPSPTSSYWMRLPEHQDIEMAGWGMVTESGEVEMKGKHFKSASSYVCALASELLRPPAPAPPVPPETEGKLKPASKPAPKPKFTYKSGSEFILSDAVPPAGYICAGN